VSSKRSLRRRLVPNVLREPTGEARGAEDQVGAEDASKLNPRAESPRLLDERLDRIEQKPRIPPREQSAGNRGPGALGRHLSTDGTPRLHDGYRRSSRAVFEARRPSTIHTAAGPAVSLMSKSMRTA